MTGIEIIKKQRNIFIYKLKVRIGEFIEKLSIGHYGDRLKRWYHLKYIYPRWEKEQKSWEDIQFKSNLKWYDEWIQKQYDLPWYLRLKFYILTKWFKKKVRVDISKLKIKKPKEEGEL